MQRIRPHARECISERDRVSARNSPIHGKGLFALRRMERRRKIGEISGRLVRLPAARRAVASRRRIFLIELSDRIALDCSAGNAFKWMNHSCAPNCYLRVFANRVEVYALRRIEPGSELTLDYGMTPHRRGMRCRCGGIPCRGII